MTVPPELVQPRAMQAILVDLSLGAALPDLDETLGYRGQVMRRHAYYLDVLGDHGVSDSLFQASFDHYQRRQPLFTALYDSVLAELSRREARLQE